MHKEELIQLHTLLVRVKNYFEEHTFCSGEFEQSIRFILALCTYIGAKQNISTPSSCLATSSHLSWTPRSFRAQGGFLHECKNLPRELR